MPDLIEPTEQDSKADRDRIARVNRNRRIRAAYDRLKREHDRREALRRLGNKHGLAPKTVRDIVYGQR